LFAKKAGKKQPAGGKRKLSVFAVEDEEAKPTKALVPIEYTAEELAAAAAPATTMAEDDEDDPAAAASCSWLFISRSFRGRLETRRSRALIFTKACSFV
jgi:RNA-binding protein 25